MWSGGPSPRQLLFPAPRVGAQPQTGSAAAATLTGLRTAGKSPRPARCGSTVVPAARCPLRCCCPCICPVISVARAMRQEATEKQKSSPMHSHLGCWTCGAVLSRRPGGCASAREIRPAAAKGARLRRPRACPTTQMEERRDRPSEGALIGAADNRCAGACCASSSSPGAPLPRSGSAISTAAPAPARAATSLACNLVLSAASSKQQPTLLWEGSS